MTHQELLLGPVVTLCIVEKIVSDQKGPIASQKSSIGIRQKLTVDLLLRASEVDGLDTTNLLSRGTSGGPGSRDSRSSDDIESGHHGAPLNGGRDQLPRQWRAQSFREASGGHDGMD